MTDRRSSERFQARVRADGTLRVVHDVYVLRDETECVALSAQLVAPGEALTLAMHTGRALRARRMTVRAIRTLAIGRELRYRLSLGPARRRDESEDGQS